MGLIIAQAVFLGFQGAFLVTNLIQERALWSPLFFICIHSAMLVYLLRLHRKEMRS